MLDGQRVLGFDLETTGFDPRSDRIVQYAFVGSDFDGLHVGLQSVVDPGVRIPPEATSVHGIRMQMFPERVDSPITWMFFQICL